MLQALVASPSVLFLTALGMMLFRPPDLHLYEMDRIALGVLIYFVLLRALLLKQRLQFAGSVQWPLLAIVVWSLFRLVSQPYSSQSWSVFAAKWLVPLLLFHLAGVVFKDESSLRRFEIFSWGALTYLCLIAVFFLFRWKALIFPRFILDQNIGIHADRARGPFLQAVANGMALSLLGLLALDSFRRHKLPKPVGTALFVLLPLAILATKTRAVWLAAAVSIVLLAFTSQNNRIRRVCLCAILVATAGFSFVFLTMHGWRTFSERFEESSPVEFRMALYRAGWDMIQERPMLGWNASEIQSQLEQRIDDFHQEAFYFHNTFLEVTVAYGLVGLGLYVWLIVDLLMLARRPFPERLYAASRGFLDAGFRSLWPMMLFVYVLNSCFVVMNYQFVNGFLFTLAGMMAAQDRRLCQYLNNPIPAITHAHWTTVRL